MVVRRNLNTLFMKKILSTIAIIAIAIAAISCKKDTKAPAPEDLAPLPTAGSLEIEFEGMVGTDGLVLGTQTYTNAAGNTFNVSMYKYYISNIKLTRSDNSVWVQPDSYYLIDYSVPLSTTISVPNVPYGNYKSMEFMIGVDSTHNVSGAQTGALDPANGMFWSWSTGYIMAKIEGTSPQSTASGNNLIFHIGGFSGPNNVLKTVSPSFNGDSAIVSPTISPKIHLANDLLQWFESPTTVDFSTLNTIHMSGTAAKTISDNYADMFSVEHIHNN